MNRPDFELWLEFEEMETWDGDDPENDFFNMQIRLATGQTYALNAWTYGYVEHAHLKDEITGEPVSYLMLPDLLVQRRERSLLETVVSDLLRLGYLREEWLVPVDENT